MTDEFAQLSKNYQALLQAQQTLSLSTASASAVPDSSYAPFVRDSAGVFYILVSALAKHTENLHQNPQASLLFMRPEAQSPNLFARERAVLHCHARAVPRDDPGYFPAMRALHAKFGDIINVLEGLPDFHLFALQAHSGRYIVGFGRAYAISVDNDGIQSL